MSVSVPVRMFATATCPYCTRAEHLLRLKGVTTLELIRTDLDPAARKRMIELSGRYTVPQIFIGDYHVGGCDDLYALEQAGKLDALLHNASADHR